jgi:hypothetical protein
VISDDSGPGMLRPEGFAMLTFRKRVTETHVRLVSSRRWRSCRREGRTATVLGAGQPAAVPWRPDALE